LTLLRKHLRVRLVVQSSVEESRSVMDCFGCCQKRLAVRTENGTIKGTRMVSNGGEEIFSFRGIPYGKPPVGALRFRRSEPAPPWEGVLNGKKEAKKSFQPNLFYPKSPLREGGEDCLYLNVYTKSLPNTEEMNETTPINGAEVTTSPMPVIVFLHGGAFVVGACESMMYGPQVLLDRDVVLVGVNYRLGVLGFLSLETDACPGNLGLHDQLLALQWVQQHISCFGGDPGNVTLMGESAGAMSAMCHMVSPLSKGLFHRVVSLSGTPSHVLLRNSRKPSMYAKAVAQRLGLRDCSDDAKTLEFLQSVKSLDIVKQTDCFLDWDYGHPINWTPVIDDYCTYPMMPQSFEQALKSGNFNKVPIIILNCEREGLILSAPYYKEPKRWKLLTQMWEEFAPSLILGVDRDLQTPTDKSLVRKVQERYWPGMELDQLPATEENLGKLTDIYSMAWFLASSDVDAARLADAGVPVFKLLLTQPPNFSLMELFRLPLSKLALSFSYQSMGMSDPYGKTFGVCHGDDLMYLFPMNPPGFPKGVITEDQLSTRASLLDVLTSFTETGVPSFGSQHILPVVKGSEGGVSYFDLGKVNGVVRDQKFVDEIRFWQDVSDESHKASSSLSDAPITIFYDKIAVERYEV